MKFKSIGGSDSVTGSAHLIIDEDGFECVLDYGMFQGLGKETLSRNQHLGINPHRLNAIVLSHAHIDHSGRIPLLIKNGYKGPIYCTPGTYDLCRILLLDSAHIQEADVHYVNKIRKRRGQDLLDPLYTVTDVERSLKYFKAVPYNNWFSLNSNLKFKFIENGHITGSAAVELQWQNPTPRRLLYTGDVGRYHDLLLKAPQPFDRVDFILCESTYGDRLHEPASNMEAQLLKTVSDICITNKGKLFIPAFSLGRTQEIVFLMDRLKTKGMWPDVPVFVDSPLSFSATEIVRRHHECFNSSLTTYIQTDPDPFGFNQLHYIRDRSDSKALRDSDAPAIIISASGMADAGRIKHHLLKGLADTKNGVLIVGYCSPNALGAKLLNGATQVTVFGTPITVKATVYSMMSFSAHADARELIQYLSCQDAATVKNLYLVHGEDAVKTKFKFRLQALGYSDVQIPQPGVTYTLN
jgi:metallo-beta-lactamase family protein